MNTAQTPKVEADWIRRLADTHSSGDRNVWVIDLGSRNVLVGPEDLGGTSPDVLLSALQKAVQGSEVTAVESPLGSLVDVGKTREPLVRVLRSAHEVFEGKVGRRSKNTVPVDIVIWADRVFLGKDIDLSENYLPADCFVPLGQSGEGLHTRFPGQDNFVTRVVLRSLDPDRAAATREAQAITLPALFRSREPGNPKVEMASSVAEASSTCGQLLTQAQAVGTGVPVAAPHCGRALPVSPVRPTCSGLDVGAQTVANSTAPAGQGATSGSGNSPTNSGNSGVSAPADASTPPETQAGSGTAPTGSDGGVMPTTPTEPSPVPETGNPQAPNVTPQEPVDSGTPEAQPPDPVPDQGPDPVEFLPAMAEGFADAPGALWFVTGSAPRFEPEPGLALWLRSPLEGAALAVQRSDGNPSLLSGQSVALSPQQGGEAALADADAIAERAVFDVMLTVPASALCRIEQSQIEATVALPLGNGLRVRRDFQISLAAGRCVDIGATQTLRLGKVEVP